MNRRRSSVRVPRAEQQKYMQNKRDKQDMETFQTFVLVSLLNSFCGVVIAKSRKVPSLTVPQPQVKKLLFPEGEINLFKLAQDYSKNLFDADLQNGMKRDSAMRRLEKNRKTFVHNMMFDLLLEKGFFFNSTLSRKTKKTLRMERITTIFLEGMLFLHHEEMIDLGKEVLDEIDARLFGKKEICIEANDPTIMTLTIEKSTCASL
ncbi:hypothetical protein EIN_169320 [Entamoeba invadens IP1]|uniref:Uncharacterized protein n=1 Tax=Entamoeba invadens IP1 TaxID=370355 RepID=A0A0A1TVM8_ENTIV|nr:hypothetical protein EIN_169320 [Entamoeba invadens IP1]ELP84497.1 hypothetical protein EIN_169320 [Entamoeba invadens IP1]|eukprot:XP_004183843.1 hypothetical protein EIN_169320 [Entamoeba invadens IP1]